MIPLEEPANDVCGVTTKDLAIGDRLGELIVYCFRAWVLVASDALSASAKPAELLLRATVTRLVTGENT